MADQLGSGRRGGNCLSSAAAAGPSRRPVRSAARVCAARPRCALPEQNVQRLRPIPGRHRRAHFRGRMRGPVRAAVMGQHPGDHVLRQRRGVNLRGAEQGVTEDPLHVGQRHLGVAGHPIGGSVTEIVQRPIGAQRAISSAEHPIGGVVGQRPQRSSQCPPQRVVGLSRDQAARLCLVQPQPHERVRRGRHRLHHPAALAHHRDQLLTRVCVALTAAQQLRGPRARGHPERDQGPIPVRNKLGEQVVELPVRDTVRHPLDLPRPIEPRPFVAEGLHRIVVGVRPALTRSGRAK